ncbi:MAG: hypothetical protein QM733_00830 [Ilumatobacteraceae bacterium]
MEINGAEPSKPVLCVFVGVSHDPAEAQRMRDVHLQRYARSTVEHYRFADVSFADIEGYEYDAGLARNIAKHGLEKFNGFLADLQVWGTPDQVATKLLDDVRRTDAGAVLVTLSYGGMSPEVADANDDLFVREVLPVLQAHDVGGAIGVTHAAQAAQAEMASR